MKLLETLTQTPGIAGREQRMRDLILRETRGLFDETRVDPIGNLIAVRHARPPKSTAKKKNPVKIMLAAHMDQIGFMVRHIDDDGFLWLQAVGGFDTRNLFARMVTVCTEDGDIPGVLNPGGKPIHIASAGDRKKVPDLDAFFVDLGLTGRQVSKRVRIGDMVVIRAPFTRVGRMITAQALDNRIACWVAIRAIEQLKAHHCEIHCAFTSQEEVGCRGAGPAADSIQPDIAIALDTTLCCDTPGVPSTDSVTRQGEGAGLMVMDSSTINDEELLRTFESLAAKRKIKAQRTILPRGGTDASTIQRKAAGHRVMTVVCPVRYIHTVTETTHLDDLHACRDLVAAYLASVR